MIVICQLRFTFEVDDVGQDPPQVLGLAPGERPHLSIVRDEPRFNPDHPASAS